MSPPSADALRRRSEYLAGILLLLVVVVLWTCSNFLTNTVLTSGYDKPFLVTYANTSSFALYLVPFLLSSRLRSRVFGCAEARRNGLGAGAALRLQGVSSDDGDVESEGWLKKLGFDLPPTFAAPLRVEGDGHNEAERGVYRPVLASSSGNDTTREAGAAPAASRCNSPLLSRPTSTYSATRRTSLTAGIRPNLDRPRSLRASNASLLSHSARPSSIDGRRPRTEIPVFTDILGESGDLTSAVAPDSLPPLTLRQTAVLACQFTMVWFGANWSINAGLGLTSVASGTTIGSASGFFTLGLGALLGVDKFTLGRIGAVSMSFIGVMLVTAADTGSSGANGGGSGTSSAIASSLMKRAVKDGNTVSRLALAAAAPPLNAPLGDMLALLSAFLYSIYVMLLKVKIGSEDRISMPLMFGLVGAFNIVALWPIGVLLHVTGIETFALPQDRMTWLGVVVNMMITLVSDLVYLMAMLKSSPLASTLGLSLTIPLAVAGDVYRGSHSGGKQAAFGSILVLASFVAIGVADNVAMRGEGILKDDEDEQEEDEEGQFYDGTTEEEEEEGDVEPATMLMDKEDGDKDMEVGRGRRRFSR